MSCVTPRLHELNLHTYTERESKEREGSVYAYMYADIQGAGRKGIEGGRSSKQHVATVRSKSTRGSNTQNQKRKKRKWIKRRTECSGTQCIKTKCVASKQSVLLQESKVCCIKARCVKAKCMKAKCCSVFKNPFGSVHHLSASCSVLQRVAVCCSVLQCAAACCSVLQCVAVHTASKKNPSQPPPAP